MTEMRALTIDALGAKADGIATAGGDRAIYVPFALPGETVAADVDGDAARVTRLITASPERIAPVCQHFTVCGGCAIQHLARSPYAEWKRSLVVQALAARGLEAEVAQLRIAEGYRRRATFSAARDGNAVVLGFNRVQSHEIVDLNMCPVLAPSIVAALPGLRALMDVLLPRRDGARVSVTALDAGLDINVEGISKKRDAALLTEIASHARVLSAARISIDGEPLFEARPPVLDMGGVDVQVPPGGFIQAMADGERLLREAIVGAVGKAKTVADLFCGAGAFTFALARRSKVTAADGGGEAIAALEAAYRHATGLKPVTALRRDLFREPFSRLELNRFDAVVFDPPRAGAEAQARMIAKSGVKKVVAASCNPGTAARDLRHLVDGGYTLDEVVPVDQFHFTPHVELVAVLSR